MIPAISYWAFPGGLAGTADIEQTIAQAAKAGFRGIELSIGTSGELTHRTSPKRCAQIVAAAREAGIRITSTASGVFWEMSLTDPKASVRRRALVFLKDALRVTAELRAGAMLVIPGCVHADFIPGCKAVPYDFVYKTAVAQIREAAKVAERLPVQIAIENVWNKFLLSPLEFVAFLKDCRSRAVKAYYDVANCVAYGVSADWVRILGRRIARVHFKEYKRRRNPDGSLTWTGFPEGFAHPLGSGDVDYPAVLRALRRVGYRGPVTYEYLNFEGDPKVVKRCAREFAKVLAA